MEEILREAFKINTKRDKKLQELRKLIIDKINNPLNPGNKKIIIFTAFADTAKYLYDNLASGILEKLEIGRASCRERVSSPV